MKEKQIWPDFETYFIDTVFKRVWYRQQKRPIDQWNRIETLGSKHINMDNGYFTKVQSQFIAERIAFFQQTVAAVGHPYKEKQTSHLI